jgi:ribosomal protein S6--L-glutamate ligase
MPPGSLEQVVFRMDVLHRLQARGVAILNPPAAVEACVDKYLATAKLEAAGLLVPPTLACQNAEAALEGFDRLGRDVVVKPLFGSEGRGMVRVTDSETAWRVFRTLERMQTVLYLQKYIEHAGWDLRVFVIGNRVVAGMRRFAGADWRTNVAQGGRAEAVEVPFEQRRLALRAMAAVHAHVAGVDLLQGTDGSWYVLEVNSVPGWRALAPVTKIDVASLLIRFVVDEYRAC